MKSLPVYTTWKRTFIPILISLLLFACTPTSSSSPTPSPAVSPSVTATTAQTSLAPATVTPSSATETSPASSPTSPSATSPATQVPEQLVIEPQNAADLQQVDQIGLPGVVNFTWLPDGASLALATETEIDLYRINPVEGFGKINAPATVVLTPSPDGEQLATAGTDHVVHLWALPDGTELHTLTGHTAAVTGLSFSPDAKTLASSSEDNSIKLWDTASGELLQDWKVSFLPSGVAFSPDGDLVAGFDNQNFAVHLLQVSNGQEQRSLTWTEHASPVLYSASFSPDWQALAWVARGTVQLMDVASGDLGQTLSHEDFVSAISWSPDSRLLASAAAATVNGDFQPAILVWDTADGQPANTIPQPEPVVNLAFSPDGGRLAALNGSGMINLLAVPK